MPRNITYGGTLDMRWEFGSWTLLHEIMVSWTDGQKQLAAFYVPAGFKTDLASIPKIVPRWIFPKIGPQNLPAVVHDWCYTGKTDLTKDEADLLFLDGMKAKGVAGWRRKLMYAAVQIGGDGYWVDRLEAR